MLENNISIVYNFHTSKIFFLTNVYFKGVKELFTDAAVCYDPLSGEFNVISGPGDELGNVLCLGRLADSILALDKYSRFLLLSDFEWTFSSIPPLPVNQLENPVILTYQSCLLVIDGSAMWVYDNGICDWMKFQLSTPEGAIESSPKNCFIILAGKLFVCICSQKKVYSVELQQVVDTVLSTQMTAQDAADSHDTKEMIVKPSVHLSQLTLQLNLILKGVNFIFLHGNNILAFHTTKPTRVSSTYIERVYYYDVQCYHWHNVECVCPDIINGCWFSMAGCAVIVEFSTAWNSWGKAKLYKIKLSKQ